MDENLIINIIAKLQGNGFDEAINKLKNLENQTNNIEGLSPYINPNVIGDATEELENIQNKTDEFTGLAPPINPTVIGDAIDKLDEIQKKANTFEEATYNINPTVVGNALEKLDEIRKIADFDGLSTYINPTVVGNALEKLENIRKVAEFDGLAPHINPTVIGDAITELENIQNKADDLDGLSPRIKPTVDDSEALGALQNIQNQVENMTSGLGSGITGILGTVGAEQLMSGGVQTAIDLDKAWRNWVGSLQQTGMSFDQAKTKANQFKSTINQLASQGQSNDSLFKNIAGLVINLNNNVSDSMLGMTEKVVAGYEMLGGRTGATLYEMEKEFKDFLSTGSLGRMQDTLSSLKDPEKWKGLLEGADTVDERIKVMHDMLAEEGIMGALNIDAPSKSIDSLKAIFDAAMTNIGTALITVIKPIADAFTYLDDTTKGLSTTILSSMAVIGLLGVGLGGVVGALGSVIPSITSGFGAFTSALGMITPGMTAATAAGAGLRTTLGVLFTGQSLATVGNYGFVNSLKATISGQNAAKMSTMSFTDAISNNSAVQTVNNTVQSITNRLQNERTQIQQKLTVASVQQSIANSLEAIKLQLLNGQTSVAALYEVNYEKAKQRSLIASIKNAAIRAKETVVTGALAAKEGVLVAATIVSTAVSEVYAFIREKVTLANIRAAGAVVLATTKTLASATAERIASTVSAVYTTIKNAQILTTIRQGAVQGIAAAKTLALATAERIASAATAAYNFVKSGGITLTLKDVAAKGLQSAANLKTAISAGIMTAAQIGLNAAMMAMPYALIIVGLVALGAAFKYLYDMFPDFKNGINEIGDGIKELFGALMSGDFNKIGDILQNAFNVLPEWLGNINQQLEPAITGMVDSFSNWAGNVDWLGAIQQSFGDIASWIAGATKNIGNWFVDGLKGISEGLSDWLAGGGEGGQAAGQAIYDGLVGWWEANGGTIVEIFSTIFLEIIPLLGEIGLKIAETLGLAILQGFEWIGQQIAVAWENNVSKPFWDWLNGIPGWIYNGLMAAVTSVTQWAMELATQGYMAASQFVQSIVTWFRQLPGLIWTWLVTTAGRISAFTGVALSRAITVGTNILNGILTNVKNIPQMVYNELLRVGTLIMSAAGALYQKALALGQGIWQKIKEGLGIGSPGHIYWMIFDEFGRVHNLMDSTSKTWMDNAQNLGNSIIDGFGNPILPRIENEGIAPYDYDYNPSEHKWPFGNWSNGDYHVPVSSAVVVKNEDIQSDKNVDVTVKNHQTFYINGGGDPEQIAQQVEQSLTAVLPVSIMEALIRALNQHNGSNGNI